MQGQYRVITHKHNPSLHHAFYNNTTKARAAVPNAAKLTLLGPAPVFAPAGVIEDFAVGDFAGSVVVEL